MGLFERLWLVVDGNNVYAQEGFKGRSARFGIAFKDRYCPFGMVLTDGKRIATPLGRQFPQEKGLQTIKAPEIGYRLSWEDVEPMLQAANSLVARMYEKVFNRTMKPANGLLAIGPDGEMYELRQRHVERSRVLCISSSHAKGVHVGDAYIDLSGNRVNWAIIVYGGIPYLTYLPYLHWLRHFLECYGLYGLLREGEKELMKELLKVWTPVCFHAKDGELHLTFPVGGYTTTRQIGQIIWEGKGRHGVKMLIATENGIYACLLRYSENGSKPLVFLELR